MASDEAAPRRALGGLLRRALRQQELHDVVERQRRRPRRRADEAGDAGGVAHRAPRLVVELHAHQDVAGQHLAVDLLALAVLDLGDLFGGHLDLEDVVADVQVLHAGLEVGLHLVLVAGVGVDDVPVAGPQAQVLLERDGRVFVLVFGSRSLPRRSAGARRPRARRPRRRSVAVLERRVLDGLGRGALLETTRRPRLRSRSPGPRLRRARRTRRRPFRPRSKSLVSPLNFSGQVSRTPSSRALARPRSTSPISATMNARKTSTTVV